MKRTKTAMLLAVLLSFCLQGCASKTPELDGTLFTNGWRSSTADYLYYCHDDQLSVLEYSSMKTGTLCSKPNCTHTGKSCISRRLDSSVPLVMDGCAYYFVDDDMQFYENDDGKSDVKIGSTLCCWNLRSNKEKKLLNVDGCSSDSAYGWLLHDGAIYYVANRLSRSYDESGNLLGCASTGGEMNLCYINLSNSDNAGLCSLYDVEKLSEYYPQAPHSGETVMKGIFDNKIYFNIAFAEDGDFGSYDYVYRHYVTYYDLTDGMYHGTPEDYGNIAFSQVTYCSEDYLVIQSDRQISVMKKRSAEPIILQNDDFSNECFYRYNPMSVFDDIVFCGGKAYNLETGEVRELELLKPYEKNTNPKRVIAKYGNDYIIIDDAQNFEKIPAEELLK